MKALAILCILISNAFCYNSFDEVMSSARDGNPAALYNLGLIYYGYKVNFNNGVVIGDGISRNPDKAFKCFSQAVEAIKENMISDEYIISDELSAKIAYMLGKCYSEGIGVEKDSKKAYACWKFAADVGIADAQYEISKCYAEGKGVEENLKNSELWLDQAAKNGNLKAKAKTGDIGYFIGYAAKKIKEESAPIIDSIKKGYNHSD
jgi:TPR repeat protein